MPEHPKLVDVAISFEKRIKNGEELSGFKILGDWIRAIFKLPKMKGEVKGYLYLVAALPSC